ncbi:hypothetical protein GYMLUDRAFT_466322 [Collybiopsis luxurians FD-317 M1]|uniref:Ubiquitin 3 binding protein But2 C-terminal domain-containing protein n=1 Tax=Collybiopsis luxurians FD-317 M1 TaxID=944289 RepID=A0A0D0C5H2_9AGAR|nr:hypothetical protein GYMLUDRAFT_466322 [Collybiopsis luxurians FD-317 M1]
MRLTLSTLVLGLVCVAQAAPRFPIDNELNVRASLPPKNNTVALPSRTLEAQSIKILFKDDGARATDQEKVKQVVRSAITKAKQPLRLHESLTVKDFHWTFVGEAPASNPFKFMVFGLPICQAAGDRHCVLTVEYTKGFFPKSLRVTDGTEKKILFEDSDLLEGQSEGRWVVFEL